MSSKSKNPIRDIMKLAGKRPVAVLLGSAFIPIGLFFYYWLIIHPEYARFAQQPAFFMEKRFLLEHLRIPGGALDILAAFLTDLFQIGWLGAGIFAGLTCIAFPLLRKVMRPGSWWIAPLLPTVLLVMTQSRYDYPLSTTLALILALAAFLVHRDCPPKKSWFRFGLDLPLMILVYILSPGAMLLFSLLCVLHAGLNSGEKSLNRILFPLGYLSLALLLPLLAGAAVSVIPIRDLYLRHALLGFGDGTPPEAGSRLPLESILGFLILILSGIFFIRRDEETVRGRRIRQIQIPVALILVLAAGWMGVERNEKEALAIRHAAHNGEWERVIKLIKPSTLRNPLCLFHINRAQFHTGKMASSFFTVPQNFGRYGLFLHKDIGFQYPLDNADFFFEMGHVTEAERWASEALTLYGEWSEVLKRLALINILQDDQPAAAQYLNRLRQNPVSRSWADHYLSCLVDPAKLRGEPLLQKLHACMPRHDFLVMGDHPELDLENMLDQAPNNRMAFEYLMTDCLIARDLEGFVKNLIRFKALVKPTLPNHHEEALIAYLALNKSPDSTAAKIKIQKSSIDRFRDFERLLSKHGGNSDAAYADLKRNYGGTYWFYMLYAKPVTKP